MSDNTLVLLRTLGPQARYSATVILECIACSPDRRTTVRQPAWNSFSLYEVMDKNDRKAMGPYRVPERSKQVDYFLWCAPGVRQHLVGCCKVSCDGENGQAGWCEPIAACDKSRNTTAL